MAERAREIRVPAGVWIFGLAILLALVAYLPALDAPFVFDDHNDIVDNEALHQFFPPRWLEGNKRPLAALTFAANWWLSPGEPLGFRAVNLFVHLINFGLATALFRWVFARPRVGLSLANARLLAPLVAGLWLLHPLDTSAVTYIVHRYESFAATFYLLALNGFLRSSKEGSPRLGLVVAYGAALLGGLVKETLITLPIVALLLDGALSEEGIVRTLERRRWGYFGLLLSLVPMLVFAIVIPPGESQRFDGEGITSLDYLRSEPSALGWYARLVINPWPLSIDYYDWPVIRGLKDVGWTTVLGVGVLSVAAYGAVRRRFWALPLVVALLILAPTSSFIPLRHELVAERRLYLPLLALFAGAGVAVVRAVAERKTLARGVLGVAFGLGLASTVLTLKRNVQYLDPLTLYAAETSTRPGNARAHGWYGRYLADFAEPERALWHIERANALDPLVPGLQRQRARVLSLVGRHHDAAEVARRILAREPDDAGALETAVLFLPRAGAVKELVGLLERRVFSHGPEALFVEQLAWYLAIAPDVRDGARALALLRELELRGEVNSSQAEVRAASFAALGRYDDALREVARVPAGSESDRRRLAAEATAYAEHRPWNLEDEWKSF